MKVRFESFVQCRVTPDEGLVEILKPGNLSEALRGYADEDREDPRSFSYIDCRHDVYVAIELEGEDVQIIPGRSINQNGQDPVPGDVVFVTDPFRDCEPMDLFRANLQRYWFFYEDLLVARGEKPYRVRRWMGRTQYTDFVGTRAEFISEYRGRFDQILFNRDRYDRAVFERYMARTWCEIPFIDGV